MELTALAWWCSRGDSSHFCRRPFARWDPGCFFAVSYLFACFSLGNESALFSGGLADRSACAGGALDCLARCRTTNRTTRDGTVGCSPFGASRLFAGCFALNTRHQRFRITTILTNRAKWSNLLDGDLESCTPLLILHTTLWQ